MKTRKVLRRALLVTVLLAAGWALSPPGGEAISMDTGPGEEWLLTNAAQQRTAAGDCSHMGSFDTCRELCYYGSPTGQFDCFPN